MELKETVYYENERPEMLPFIPSSAKKSLEIGCGHGRFSAQLVKNGIETWGIEPDSHSFEVASKKLFKVLEGTIESQIDNVPDNYFDVIIMNDVLEHLLYPWDNLKQLRSKLSDNGVLISSIPNVRYSKNIFNLIIKRNWEYTESGILDSTHFRFFTRKSIKTLYRKSGYSVQTIKGINVTNSFLYFPFAVLFNIVFLCSQLDMFYMQFATVVKKNDL